MSHFEYMELQGQLTIFELMDELELLKFKKSSTNVSRPTNKKLKGPHKVGYIVRR